MKAFQIWLPHVAKFIFKDLEIDSESEFCLPQPKVKSKWITYGSSATQCVGAEKPSATWPSIVARSLDVEFVALGYGGNCHLDPMVARMIRDQSADCISLCLGANVYMQSSLNERTLGSSVLAFIDIIRETNPEVPMIVMSPYHMGEKETTPNLVGLTVQDIRIEIQKAVEVVQNAGDEYISYITGLNILGPECKDLLPDGLHANAEGYKIYLINRKSEQSFPRKVRFLVQQVILGEYPSWRQFLISTISG